MKELFLGQLKSAITMQLKAEIAEGNLDISKEYNYEANFARIYSVIKENKITAIALSTFGVSKRDLRDLFKECLVEAGVQV